MTARFLIALLEANQDKDGHVAVPEVLHPYGAPELL
jgi:seryl-tRNA synthetase